MFTLEIAGVAIATTDADEDEAREIFSSEDFLDDIRGFTVAGVPLWDGQAELSVRPATDDEADAFSEIDEEDEEDEDDVEDGGANIMFLVDIDQFEEDD